MVASLWHQLLGTKVRLLVDLPAGVLRGGSMRAYGGGYEPILVGGLTYIGRHRDLYSFVVGSI